MAGCRVDCLLCARPFGAIEKAARKQETEKAKACAICAQIKRVENGSR
jgi:hypothetical protein